MTDIAAFVREQRALCDPPLQAGQAGNCNLVSFNGDDVRAVGIIVFGDDLRRITGISTALPRALDIIEQQAEVNRKLAVALRRFIASVGTCACDKAYTSRAERLGYRFVDPNCLYHHFDDDIDEANAALALMPESPAPATAACQRPA